MEIDYQKLGFKCGIEIHQQLDTCKLFCPCPSVIRDDKPNIVVKRRMRAVAGELGNVDPAALHEFLRGRNLYYEAYSDTNCLVELDEEPPHPLNRQALRVVLEVALLLRAKPVDELHVMRKTVIDGSNTSGFQRTILVAQDGILETSLGPLGIPTICLEEDAARIISEEGGSVHYRLDRLGIPLIEIATSPDIKSPAHAREVAEKIGGILRASNVKRGLGTIRQDINVSIAQGERIEAKGVQDLRLVAKVVEGEVQRQLMLIETKKELLSRGAKETDYNFPVMDLTDLFKGTQSAVVQKNLDANGVMLGVRLKGLKSLLKGRFGPQIAQYARAMSGVRGLFHGDELPAYGISPEEVAAVMSRLEVSGNDSYALVSGPRQQAQKALEAALNRCTIALSHVPEETRRAKDDGTTEFMRPLPGSSRMYPETDEPFLLVDEGLLQDVLSSLPELREDKAKRFMELGLGAELATQLSKAPEASLFQELSLEFKGLEATTIVQTLLASPKEAARRYEADTSVLNPGHFRQILALLADGRISKSAVAELMAKICACPSKDVLDIASSGGLMNLSDGELRGLVEHAISENKLLNAGQLMGKIMAQTKGKADAKKVQEMIALAKK